ncbi:hypothetical protein N5923_23525 [Erwiniaceae bacterium BAC15a-03b]|uniref:Uncharacterized protein n=1 Tax=Winslowiella arboricola TaxID=2978220 RepID=A0A9J6PVC3_9GAMM|nr:hypothetical protein [Winslowiella arboricola]MCU5775079.1 hypothetical protein [Winslowiella arboricola]MCU5780467.1 hypothetical protein [Winslowiella arboricola]
MSEFKGTKEKWSYQGPLGEIISDKGGLIADLIVNGKEDENGQLMAAAPELFEALQRIEVWATTMHGHNVEYSGDHPITKAKAAIAKALGQ